MANTKNKVIAGDYEGKKGLLEIDDKIYHAIITNVF